MVPPLSPRDDSWDLQLHERFVRTTRFPGAVAQPSNSIILEFRCADI